MYKKSLKGILNKNNFKFLEREKARWLRNLSLRKAVQLEEMLLSCGLLREWHDNLFADKPVCLKIGLKRRR